VNAVAMWDDPPLRLDIPLRREPLKKPDAWGPVPRHLSVVELRLAETRLHTPCRAESYPHEVRGLLVGECPGPNTHPELPLFPWPATSSAGRLVQMAEMTPAQYLGGLYRRNLCDEHEFDRNDAAQRARELLTCLFDLPRSFRVVLCGWKVARAFDVSVTEFWKSSRLESRQRFVVIPHPSGRNLVYNDSEARDRTRAWLRWAALGEERPRRAKTV
jgi:hypothetical protein